jgi:hypothetical protein
MGMILGFSLFMGIFIGVLISIPAVIMALVATGKRAKRRRRVWPVFVPVAVATVLLLGFGIYRYPYDTGVPGSNYDLLFGHFFFVGLAYAVIPGVAAVTAFLSALWYPRDNDIANNGA